MKTLRTNDQWIHELRSEGPAATQALEDLRTYLLRALPGCLQAYDEFTQGLLEDVVQDALLRTLDSLDRFEGRSRFTTWATTIAIRMALTELRRRRWKDVSLDQLATGEPLTPASHVDPHETPETQAAQSGIIQALQDVLNKELTDRQRTAILAEMQGLPLAEIANRLGTNRNAVYKLSHDARKKLKRGLEASGYGADEIRAAFT